MGQAKDEYTKLNQSNQPEQEEWACSNCDKEIEGEPKCITDEPLCAICYDEICAKGESIAESHEGEEGEIGD